MLDDFRTEVKLNHTTCVLYVCDPLNSLKTGHTSLTGQTHRQASGKAEPGSLFVRLHRPVRETAVLTLDGVQMRIKPQLASVSLLFGPFGKQTKRG